MISIAMATYNGGLFIREQLTSLSQQNLLPDEVIISDDGSNDDTINIIKEFSLSSPFTIKLLENKTSLGITKNFERALRACSGDIIFLADQDDWWLPDKISSMMTVFEKNPGVGLVHCNAQIVNKDLTETGHTLWESFWFTEKEQRKVQIGQAFNIYLRHTVAAGMSMAFRSIYLDAIFPIPDIYSSHDAWTALIVASIADVHIVKTCLVKYRVHGVNQVMGIHKMSLYEQFKIAKRQANNETFQNLLALYTELYGRLNEIDHSGLFIIKQEKRKNVKKRLVHTITRTDLSRNILIKIMHIFIEFVKGNYFRYSYGLKSVAQDLFLR